MYTHYNMEYLPCMHVFWDILYLILYSPGLYHIFLLHWSHTKNVLVLTIICLFFYYARLMIGCVRISVSQVTVKEIECMVVVELEKAWWAARN